MQELMVVEGNPRRKRRKSTRRRYTRRRAKASNPTANPRRRTYRRRSYRRRATRNPRGGARFMGVDLKTTIGGAALTTGTKLLQGYLMPKIGIADKGVPGYVGQLVTAYVVKMLAGMAGQRAIGNKAFEYSVVNVIERVMSDIVLPSTGLGRLGQRYTLGQYNPVPAQTAIKRGVQSRFSRAALPVNTVVKPVGSTGAIERFKPRW